MNERSRFSISYALSAANACGTRLALPFSMRTNLPTLADMLSILVDTLDGRDFQAVTDDADLSTWDMVSTIAAEILATHGALTFCESLSGMDPFNAHHNTWGAQGITKMGYFAFLMDASGSRRDWHDACDAVIAALSV